VINEPYILLVESNPDDQALTLRALAKNHIQNSVRIAHDGAEALDSLMGEETSLPQMVLLDLRLPKIDGVEFLRRLREHHRTKRLPVIFLISEKQDLEIVRRHSFGPVGALAKPVDFNGLMEVVKDLGLNWIIVNEVPERAQRPA